MWRNGNFRGRPELMSDKRDSNWWRINQTYNCSKNNAVNFLMTMMTASEKEAKIRH